MSGRRILIVRLGAMGDVIHALPVAASLKHSFPQSYIAWCIDRKWAPLLEGNDCIDEVFAFDRKSIGEMLALRNRLRAARFDTIIDVQGLIKSAVIASLARPERIYGFHRSQVRERPAAWFYSKEVRVLATHVVDRNLELAKAAGASRLLRHFPLPQGDPEGSLPSSGFVLASPFAGWPAKQWPIENFQRLASDLRNEFGVELVLNLAPGAAAIDGVRTHTSGLAGLINATRRALAVIGVDSGPLHLAAALEKPGVALFGPTDPNRNGPYGSTMTTLRAPDAITSYKRRNEIDPSMRWLDPGMVLEALRARLPQRAAS
jgi:heptosyltransferase I